MESTLRGLFAYTLPIRLHVSLTPTLVQIRGNFYQRAKALFVSWRPSSVNLTAAESFARSRNQK